MGELLRTTHEKRGSLRHGSTMRVKYLPNSMWSSMCTGSIVVMTYTDGVPQVILGSCLGHFYK